MKKWEYNFLHASSENEGLEHEKEIDKMGREGWELTTVIEKNNNYVFYFKRPIE